MGTTALLFPGQGVNPVEAVRVLDAHAGHPLVERVRAATGVDHVDPAALADTRVAQPVIVAAGLLAVAAAGLGPDDVAAVVGHSLGEITALAFAGAIDPVDAVDLVAERARLGHAVHQRRPGLMLAVLKLDRDTVEAVRLQAVLDVPGVLDVAVVNGPRQLVLSGDRATAAHAADLVAEAGGVPRRLGIGGPFHSSLLEEVVPAMTARAAAVVRGDVGVPVVLSTVARTVGPGDSPVEDLGRALVRAVDWPDALRRARALGITEGVEAGPGATLATLAEHDPVLPVAGLAPPGITTT